MQFGFVFEDIISARCIGDEQILRQSLHVELSPDALTELNPVYLNHGDRICSACIIIHPNAANAIWYPIYPASRTPEPSFSVPPSSRDEPNLPLPSLFSIYLFAQQPPPQSLEAHPLHPQLTHSIS